MSKILADSNRAYFDTCAKQNQNKLFVNKEKEREKEKEKRESKTETKEESEEKEEEADKEEAEEEEGEKEKQYNSNIVTLFNRWASSSPPNNPFNNQTTIFVSLGLFSVCSFYFISSKYGCCKKTVQLLSPFFNVCQWWQRR